ncbi:MAG: aldolase/citrate lyase family protein, partial [Micromonosporaceae bacterium]
MIARSYLYVPGDAPGKLAKVLGRGADAVIVDLEDAVPPAGKDAARAGVRAWLAELSGVDTEIWVRVNPGSLGHRDVRAVLTPA